MIAKKNTMAKVRPIQINAGWYLRGLGGAYIEDIGDEDDLATAAYDNAPTTLAISKGKYVALVLNVFRFIQSTGVLKHNHLYNVNIHRVIVESLGLVPNILRDTCLHSSVSPVAGLADGVCAITLTIFDSKERHVNVFCVPIGIGVVWKPL